MKSMKVSCSYVSSFTQISDDIDVCHYFLPFCNWSIDAKKEIQKQMGAVLKDLNQQNPSTNTRQRRPGILGYNHLHFILLTKFCAFSF